MLPPTPKTYGDPTGTYGNLPAFTPPSPSLPLAPAKSGPPLYTYRHSTDSMTEEIGVQTHEELVAFINWLHSDRQLPLPAIEPSFPRVY